MTIREQLILDILQVEEPRLLEQLQLFLKQLQQEQQNSYSVLALAGSLSAEDGQEIAEDLNNDFNQIEGDW